MNWTSDMSMAGFAMSACSIVISLAAFAISILASREAARARASAESLRSSTGVPLCVMCGERALDEQFGSDPPPGSSDPTEWFEARPEPRPEPRPDWGSDERSD